MLLKKFGDRERVLRMALHAQMQSFNSLQNQKRVERREAGAGIAQALHASFQNEGKIGRTPSV